MPGVGAFVQRNAYTVSFYHDNVMVSDATIDQSKLLPKAGNWFSHTFERGEFLVTGAFYVLRAQHEGGDQIL